MMHMAFVMNKVLFFSLNNVLVWLVLELSESSVRSSQAVTSEEKRKVTYLPTTSGEVRQLAVVTAAQRKPQEEVEVNKN